MSASMWFVEPPPGEDPEWDAAVGRSPPSSDDATAWNALARMDALLVESRLEPSAEKRIPRALNILVELLNARVVLWLPSGPFPVLQSGSSFAAWADPEERTRRLSVDPACEVHGVLIDNNVKKRLSPEACFPIDNLMALGDEGDSNGGCLFAMDRPGGFSARHAALAAPFFSFIVWAQSNASASVPRPWPRRRRFPETV